MVLIKLATLAAVTRLVYTAQLPAPSANTPRYTVTGTVVNSVTNEPVPRTLVHLLGSEPQSTFTNPQGHFEFAGIPEGQVTVVAERPGFLDPRTSSNTPTRDPSVHIGPGTNDFRLALIPQSAIEGTVVDPDGDPIEGAQVQLLMEQINQGRKQWVSRGMETTDDEGKYRFQALESRPVLLCTTEQPLRPLRPGAPSTAYPLTYFPGVRNSSSAQPIDLKPGQTATANLTLTAVPTFFISGTIAGVPSGSGVWATTQTELGVPDMVNSFQPNLQTGRFVIRNFPAGEWKYIFQTSGPPDKQMRAELDLSVTSNVQGLSVVLHPLANIPVILTHAPSVAGPQQNASPGSSSPFPIVQLISTTASASQLFVAEPPPDAGKNPNEEPPHFVLQQVPSGEYRLSLLSVGSECVDTASSGSTDLLREPFVVPSGSIPQPITIAMRSDCAKIAPKVQSNGTSVASVVIVVSDSPAFQPLVIPVTPGANNASGPLSPGSYRVYAFSDLTDLEYANPEAMRDFPAQSVDLQAGQNAEVTLELIDRGTS
jgi:hypothetical protein